MTYNPPDLVTVRSYLLAKLDLQPGVTRGVDLEPGEVGIMGDPAHAATGGYHEGNDDLSRVGRLYSDYSKAESPRDRPGSNAASALDIGDFDATVNGRHITLRSLTLAIVDACKRGDPRTRDIREVIYTPDGSTVRRWDRLGIRSSGDSSHLWHTHISFHRDSEGRRAARDNFLGLLVELIEGRDDMPLSPEEYQRIVNGSITDDNALFWWLRSLADQNDTAIGATKMGKPKVPGNKQIAEKIDALAKKVETPASVALSDADREDVANRVATKLGPQLAGLVADEVAKRLSNG